MSKDRPDEEAPTLTYEGGFEAVVARMESRRAPLVFAEGEALPPLDLDFGPLKTGLVSMPHASALPRFKDRSTHLRKDLELTAQFIGAPELCKLHGLLIAHLRKRDQPPGTMALFTRLWREEHAFLLEHLDARWLVSAITTFADHGETEVQRNLGTALHMLFNTMKLYESERLYSGLASDQSFKLKRQVRGELPMEMDRFALVHGGLDVNMLGRLWLDAGEDAVIAPLARHLLNLLNADSRTVFRRLAVLRGRKMRQMREDTPRKATSWAVVCTVKAPLPEIERFIIHHLALGASYIHLFLDTPLPRSELAALTAHRQVIATQCDDEYWEETGRPRPVAHQVRQGFNANRAYQSTQADWLLHIDVDEFLHLPGPLIPILDALPEDQEALILPPAEELSLPGPTGDEALFRKAYFDAGQEAQVLEGLYPTFGQYLEAGFLSHTEGKTIARTGVDHARLWLHRLKRNGVEVEHVSRSKDVFILHRHAPDWDAFRAKMAFRMEKGSYRRGRQQPLGLADILAVLVEEHGDAAGPKIFFDEMCLARPEVLERLEAHDMLIRAKLPKSEA